MLEYEQTDKKLYIPALRTNQFKSCSRIQTNLKSGKRNTISKLFYGNVWSLFLSL